MGEYLNGPIPRCANAFDLVTVDHLQIHHPVDSLHHIAAIGILKRGETKNENKKKIKNVKLECKMRVRTRWALQRTKCNSVAKGQSNYCGFLIRAKYYTTHRRKTEYVSKALRILFTRRFSWKPAGAYETAIFPKYFTLISTLVGVSEFSFRLLLFFWRFDAYENRCYTEYETATFPHNICKCIQYTHRIMSLSFVYNSK